MLLKANYKKSFVPLKCGTGVTSIKVERGQFIFGRNKAQEELKINGSSIYRILQKFEELEQIKIETNSQYSLITICNYDAYQNIKDKNEQPADNQRTTSEQAADSKRTATEHSIEDKEYKESKEEKEGKAHLNGFACYNAEEYVLSNQIAFERICMAVSKKTDEVKIELHKYHLWMTKNEKYPLGKLAAEAGIEAWILNANDFKKKYNGQPTPSTVGKTINFDKP